MSEAKDPFAVDRCGLESPDQVAVADQGSDRPQAPVPKEVSLIPGPCMPAPGTAPGIETSQLLQRPSQPGTTRVTCIDYCPEHVEVHDIDDLSVFIGEHRPGWSHVRWINVSGLKDMQALSVLAAKYDLHPLALEDVLTSQRPKTDDYPATEAHPPRLFAVAWIAAWSTNRSASLWAATRC
jgi:Mg2+ and Co2+ transporter CorA